MSNTTAVLYLRKSTNKQDNSWDNQELKLRAFCAKNSWDILEIICEEASGGKDDREGLKRAVARAVSTHSKLVVWRTDRLGRKLSTIARLLEQENLQLVVAELGKELDPFVVSVLACAAAQERKVISSRVKEGMARAKANGAQFGNLQNLKLGGPSRKSKADQKVLDNWDQYQLIWNLHQTGSTFAQISKMMGLKNGKGNPMAPMAVKRMYDRFARIRTEMK